MRTAAAILFFGFVMLLFLVLMALSEAHAQELPATPQPQKEVCYRTTSQNPFMYEEVACSNVWYALPDPQPRKPTFLTFRRGYQAPPLRTTRQVFNKKFVALHVMAAISVVLACRDKNSGETWGSEVPAVAGVTSLDYLMSRFFSEAMAVEAPVYMTQHYLRSLYR